MIQKFFLRNWDLPHFLPQAVKALDAGSHRNDVLEQAIRAVEDDPAITVVGRGGFPDLTGRMSLDAAFMDGDGRMLGAVGNVRSYANPVSIARRLMEEGRHTMLVGPGAERFAHDHGVSRRRTLTPEMRDAWQRSIAPLLGKGEPLLDIGRRLSAHEESKQPPHPSGGPNHRDTVVMIASDGNGLSVATSTSGWAYKHPGRLGDSPVAGAGFYVDSRYGACCCTHTGEMSMRAGTARLVVAQMQSGKPVDKAVQTGLADLAALRGGHLEDLVIHAVDRHGQPHVGAFNPTGEIPYTYWTEGMAQATVRRADIVSRFVFPAAPAVRLNRPGPT